MASTSIAEASVATDASITSPRTWICATAIIAAIPLIQALLTWSWSGQMLPIQYVIRILSITAVFGEILILMIASRGGFVSEKSFRVLPKPLRWLMVIWLIFAALAFVSNLQFGSAIGLLVPALLLVRYILQILTFWAVIFLIRTAPDYRDSSYFGILSVGGFAYAMAISFFALLVPDSSKFEWLSGLPSATSVRHIANYVTIFSIAPAALFLCGAKAKNWSQLAMFAAMVVFVAWTGSRAPVLGLALALGCAVILQWRRIAATRIVTLAATFVAAVVGSVALPQPIPSYGMLRFVSEASAGVDPSSGRVEVWANSWIEILKQPFLGHGSGNFAFNMSDRYDYDLDNPHNFPLQFLYDWGFIGGGAALLVFAWMGWMIYRLRQAEPIHAFAAITAYLLMLSVGLLEGMLYHPIKIILALVMIVPLFARSAGTMRPDPSATLA